MPSTGQATSLFLSISTVTVIVTVDPTGGLSRFSDVEFTILRGRGCSHFMSQEA